MMKQLPLLVVAFSFFVVFVVGAKSPAFCTRLGEDGLRHPSLSFKEAVGKRSCETCENGAACCDGEICCDGGTACCPAASTCCNDTCCSNASQSCCPDPKYGGVCCEAELTHCCAPNYPFPSRCCPRWMVCCNGGRYGCCDPDTMKPMEEIEDHPAAANVAFSLYVDAFGDFQSLTIDLNTGYVTSKNVTGYNDWGETQRVFMFDAKRTLFYLLQANFLPSADTHVINLYTVDPKAAKATKKQVQGATDEGQIDVAGFNYNDNTGLILFSTQKLNSQKQVIAYNFYKMDPTSNVATLVSTFPQTDGVDKFVGFFHAVSADGNTVYRVGYKDVINQKDFGLGITKINGAVATTQWISNIPIPKDLGFYMSLNLYGNDFLSLAQDSFGDLAIVQWNYQTGNATLLNQLYDAYNTPYFGPLVEYINVQQTIYATLVVYNTVISKDLSRWAITVTDLTKGTTNEYVLFPWLLAETDSVAALGIPA